ncbi:MAG: hypothetical protein AUI16_08890 [Alphaproteobacteria bacterium 13_2_20CM_2_64_7]|jgi:hypothetical protein|nr:MAG: hypothetical protein AUI16_08890 [Alphaproteobacteria bacterium 13_2_20CM_2_64_7]
MRIMTDVLDLARPERPAFPAPIPDWVPASIAEYARNTLRSPALVRLVTDPRMRSVWTHFTSKDRRTGQYRQPAQVSLRGLAEASRRQDFALLMLFGLVLELAEHRPRTVLRRELEARQAEHRAMALKLWAKASTLGYLEELGESARGGAKALCTAADMLWHISSKAPVGEIIVERDRGEREVQAVAMTIAGACYWLFGSPLYTVTATLTAVALDCPVTKRKVREWGPILPSADKGSFFGLLSAVCKPEI